MAFLVAIWAAILGLKYRLSYVHMALVFLSAQLIGTYNIGADHSTYEPTVYLAIGIVAMVLGLAWARFTTRTLRVPPPAVSASPALDRRILWAFFAVNLAMIGYHYTVGGAPLFEENVLLARFDNTSSGMLGLPGRFNLFGAFFSLFLVVAYLQTMEHVGRLRALVMASTLLLVTSRLLQGNKGAVIQCMVALLIVGPYLERTYAIRGTLKRIASGIPLWLVAAGGIGATAAFFFVAQIHIVQGIGLYDNVFQALIQRVAVVSGSAFYESVTSVAPRYGHGWGAYFLNDLLYFGRAFGLNSGAYYSLNDLVSATVTGRDVLGDQFLVPVAMNGLGYLYCECGLAGIIGGGYFLGWVMGRLYFKVESVRRPLARALLFYLQLGLFWVVTRGNFGFYVPNMLLMALVFAGTVLAIAVVMSLLVRRRSVFLQRRRRSRNAGVDWSLAPEAAVRAAMR